MKTKLTLFVAVLAVALFAGGCASTVETMIEVLFPGNMGAGKEQSNLNVGTTGTVVSSFNETSAPPVEKPNTRGLILHLTFNNSLKDAVDPTRIIQAGRTNFVSDRFNEEKSSFLCDGNTVIGIPVKINESFTVSIWFRAPKSGQGSPHLFAYDGRASDTSRGWAMIFNGGDPRYPKPEGKGHFFFDGKNSRDNPFGEQEPSYYADDKWHHLVAIHDDNSGTVEVWTDGVRQIKNKYHREPKASKGEDFGRLNVGGTGFFWRNIVATVDDLRVYQRVLDEDEVEALYRYENGNGPAATLKSPQNKAGLVAHWSLDGSVKDNTDNGFDLLNEGAKPGPDRHGNSGQALQFTGKEYLRLIRPLPDMPKQTVAAWVKSENTPELMGTIFSDLTVHGGNDLIFWISPAGGRLRADKSGGVLGIDGDPTGGVFTFPENKRPGKNWFHVSWVLEEKSSKIYLNGEQTAEIPATGSNVGYHQAEIGRWFHRKGARDYFKGSIDDVRIYNRALSAEEVKALYDLEKPKAK